MPDSPIVPPCFGFPGSVLFHLITVLIAAPLLVFSPPGGPVRASESVRRLPETVVTATKTERERREIGSSITVIDRDRIERRQAPDVGSLLRTVPGVSVSNNGGGPGQQTDVRIRGAEANHTLVLLDGVELNPGNNGQYDLANLPVEIIQRIEVLRGAQSVLYGSEAIGGVVNIITREGTASSRTTARMEAGSFSTEQYSVSHSNTRGGFRYRVLAQHEESDGFSQCNEDRGCSEDDGHDQDHLYAHLAKSIRPNLHLTGSFRFTEAEVETDSVFGGVLDTADRSDDTERSGKLRLEYDSPDRVWRHAVTGSFNTVDNRFVSGTFGTNFTKTEKQKLQYQLDYRFSDTLLLTGGLSLEEDDVIGPGLTREDNAYFLQAQVDPTEYLFFTAGVRRDEFSASGFNQQTPDETTERFTLAYFPLEDSNLKLKVNGGSAIVRPTLFDLRGGFGIPANPNLRAEKSESWEIGLEKPLFDRRLALGLTYFDQTIEDKIIAGTFGVPARNARETHSEGIELSLDGRVTRALTLNASATLMDAEELTGSGTSLDLLRRPDRSGSLSANYRWTNRLSSNLVVTYNGENTQQNFTRPSCLGLAGCPRQELGGYTVANMAFEYDHSERVRVYGRVDNLLDQDDEEVFGFGTADRSAYGGVEVSF